MKTTTLTSALLLSVLAAPAWAQDLALRFQERPQGQSEQISGAGRAQLDLSGRTPRLKLQATGLPAEELEGLAVVGGYLFTADIRDLRAVLPQGGGMVAAVQSVTEQRTAEVVSNGLRVRAEPSTEAPVVGNLRGGQQVEVLEERDGWAKVKFDYSKEGWSKIAGSRPFLSLRTLPKLSHVSGKRSVFISRRGPGWEGQIKQDDDWTGDLVLRNDRHPVSSRKRLLALPDGRHSGDGGAFLAYARQLEATYAEQGYQTVIADVDSWEDVVDELEAASSAPYSRVVVISHGGWDGAIFRGHVGTRQVSGKYNEELFARFAAAVQVGTTPDAKLFSSSCHAAGTAKLEDVSYGSPYRWVHDLAARTGRQVAGPAGKTSTEYTHQHVLASFEGQGTVKQEVHVARGNKLKILHPGLTLATAATQDLPAIEDLPTPEPIEATAEPALEQPAGARAAEASAAEAPAAAPSRTGVANTPAVEPEPIPSARLELDPNGNPRIGRALGR